ncbi:hypothetical protein ABFX02_10G006100 [Erythranthe guttata]
MRPNCASDIIEHDQKSFRIKHEDDKFFTRLLSKENSKSSFRVYYGDVSSAVPFTWETCPGTPKHNSSSSDHHHHVNLMPPLTPPPSYFINNNNLDINDSFKRNSSTSKILLHNLLRRMSRPKKLPSSCHVAPTSSSPHDVISSSSLSSLSWSSSARSSFSDPITTPNVYVRKRRRFSSWGSSFDDRASAIGSLRNDDVSPPANSCFGIGKDKSDGGYSVFIVKKAFLSIVGRGRASSA